MAQRHHFAVVLRGARERKLKKSPLKGRKAKDSPLESQTTRLDGAVILVPGVLRIAVNEPVFNKQEFTLDEDVDPVLILENGVECKPNCFAEVLQAYRLLFKTPKPEAEKKKRHDYVRSRRWQEHSVSLIPHAPGQFYFLDADGRSKQRKAVQGAYRFNVEPESLDAAKERVKNFLMCMERGDYGEWERDAKCHMLFRRKEAAPIDWDALEFKKSFVPGILSSAPSATGPAGPHSIADGINQTSGAQQEHVPQRPAVSSRTKRAANSEAASRPAKRPANSNGAGPSSPTHHDVSEQADVAEDTPAPADPRQGKGKAPARAPRPDTPPRTPPTTPNAALGVGMPNNGSSRNTPSYLLGFKKSFFQGATLAAACSPQLGWNDFMDVLANAPDTVRPRLLAQLQTRIEQLVTEDIPKRDLLGYLQMLLEHPELSEAFVKAGLAAFPRLSNALELLRSKDLAPVTHVLLAVIYCHLKDVTRTHMEQVVRLVEDDAFLKIPAEMQKALQDKWTSLLLQP